MVQDAKLRCRCGEVRGVLTNASPETVNRVICHCDDCQAFLRHLGRADLLDEHGGTDIIQVAPASLAFSGDTERIAGMRLTAKGLYRFYASCCQTPLGNTVGPLIPFVGIVARSIENHDEVAGRPLGRIHGKFAIGAPPSGSDKLNLRLVARTIRMVLGWKLGGRAWPHPFFDKRSRAPRYPLATLTPTERDAL